ncbi:MAG: hypothetical protein H0U51_03625 [Propionibacteriales bacterium]|nr:hypothetical protein [Propionibacteriales bacterium]
MQVLWWLVPPLVATVVAMAWAGWVGRERDGERGENADAALARMERALNRPSVRAGAAVAQPPVEPTHGVALRRAARRPTSADASPR